jgi:hypothetical protein
MATMTRLLAFVAMRPSMTVMGDKKAGVAMQTPAFTFLYALLSYCIALRAHR